MRYALEYDPMDQNTLTIHFDKELIGNQVLSEKDKDTTMIHEQAICEDGDTVVCDDVENNGRINRKEISYSLKIMGDTIYSLKGVRNVEICDYEIILEKSLFFEWKWIIDSVVATVLMFIDHKGKAIETPFNQTDRKDEKRKKTKFAEIYWDF